MIDLRSLAAFEAAAAKNSPIDFDTKNISIPGSEHFLPIAANNGLRFHVDSCRYIGGKFSCSGWALSPLTGEPLKRIFALLDNRIIGMAAPKLRVDVRQSLQAVYDNLGYTINNQVNRTIFNGEIVKLLAITNHGATAIDAECRSENKTNIVYPSRIEFDEYRIILSNAKRETHTRFKVDNNIRHHVDEISISSSDVSVSGWAVLPSNTKANLNVSLVYEDNVFSPPELFLHPRRDVASKIGMPPVGINAGFILRFSSGDIKNLDPTKLKLLIASDDEINAVANIVDIVPSISTARHLYSPL
ncbi:hypothetical protein [Limimaricola sp. AA108-03]|uniref:hypothetical protein n=1 Tax=Limimaricola sp. AA108-03 TaxID=3425945 RepID=UPI003D77D1DB